MKISFKTCAPLCLCILLTGCVSIQLSPEDRKEKWEASNISYAKKLFAERETDKFPWGYDAMRTVIQDKRTIDTPLHLCEASSLAILSGDDALAFNTIDNTLDLLEYFWDEKSERSAASLWGRESDKVFKGDPYEQSTLYTLYGMLQMERGEVDMARASFKRAMLLDGDAEKNEFQSDFGLPFLLAAKCSDLLGETEERDTFLNYAMSAYCGMYPWNGYPNWSKGLQAEAKNAIQNNSSLNPLTAHFLSWCNFDESYFQDMLETRFKESGAISFSDWKAQELPDMEALKSQLPADNKLDFNATFVLWNGWGPTMERAGNYDEIRVINPGKKLVWKRTVDDVVYELPIVYALSLPNGQVAELPFVDEIGNISYQACTRGKRQMDVELKTQAAIKAGSILSADLLWLLGLVLANNDSTQMIGYAFIASGAVIHLIALNMHTEADIRHWENLPEQFSIASLKLPPGENVLLLKAYARDEAANALIPIGVKELTVQVSPDAPVNFYHLFP